MAYRWAQFCAYLRLARQQRAAERLATLVDTSHAYAGGKEATQLAKDLRAAAQA